MNILVNIGKKLGIVPAPIVDTASSVMRGRAILDANRLGIFDALEKGALGSEELAQRTGTSVIGVELLCDALVACGYLERRSSKYANGPWVTKWILESGYGITHFLKVQENVWERASTLGECVRAGHTMENPHEGLVAKPSEAAEGYVLGMKAAAQLLIPHFSKKIKVPPTASKLLDLGGSHGDYSRALLNLNPKLSATVMDLEGPVVAARELDQRLGGTKRLHFEVGNLLEGSLEPGWDIALMISVLHVFDQEQARSILSKVAGALKPGGSFWILDHMRGVSASRDNVVAMMGLNYLTLGGRSYHVKEVHQLMKEAGFRRSRTIKLPMQVGATIVQGEC